MEGGAACKSQWVELKANVYKALGHRRSLVLSRRQSFATEALCKAKKTGSNSPIILLLIVNENIATRLFIAAFLPLSIL